MSPRPLAAAAEEGLPRGGTDSHGRARTGTDGRQEFLQIDATHEPRCCAGSRCLQEGAGLSTLAVQSARLMRVALERLG